MLNVIDKIKGIQVDRYYTVGHESDPYYDITWKNFNVPGKRGKFKFPDFYSNNAVNIIVNKYLMKKYGEFKGERSLVDLVERIAKVVVLWSVHQGYFGQNSYGQLINLFTAKGIEEKYTKDALKDSAHNFFSFVNNLISDNKNIQAYYDELRYIYSHQIGIFNTPVNINLGNIFRNGYQTSACFILHIDDNLRDIANAVKEQMLIFRDGSGVGSNLSNLRSSKEYIRGGGLSSGVMSWIQIYDVAANSTKSGGITRRSAIMYELDPDHGDILEFIESKEIEEDFGDELKTLGYEIDFSDVNSGYYRLKYQNINFSVHASNAFMKAAKSNSEWALLERYPIKEDLDVDNAEKTTEEQGEFYRVEDDWFLKRDDGFYKVIEWRNAGDLLKSIAKAAWRSGDPGMQYHDTINKWRTSEEIIRSSNPCSEFFAPDGASCNLGALNLLSFYNVDSGRFDLDGFKHAIEILGLAMDSFVDYSKYPVEQIDKTTKLYRNIGLGFSNLGSLLMVHGTPYGSSEGRNIAGGLAAMLTGTAFRLSQDLGTVFGGYPKYSSDKSYLKSTILRHYENVMRQYFLNEEKTFSRAIFREAYQLWAKIVNKIEDVNVQFRNSQVSLMAPNGTTGLAMDNSTTGIEPPFSFIVYKLLTDGTYMTIVNGELKTALKRLGYYEEDIEKIVQYITNNEGRILESGVKKEHLPIFKSASGDNILDWQEHINMMASIQPYISGAISKTINIPNDFTEEQIRDIYIYAWEKGLKAISIYRDGSKGSQVLSSKKDDEQEGEKNTLLSSFDVSKIGTDETQDIYAQNPRCASCGGPTQISGSCYVCLNCGETTGCS